VEDRTGGSYVVVARRYRPRAFDELVGQQHVGRALKNAIETNRVGHAYLFTGARGVGKTSTARIFAKALNDPSGPTTTPDSENDIAQAIDAGEDVDVIEIDGASNRGIDEIRSLRANIGVRPSRSRFKIYIIDEVHMLTPAAFNALLKTLEEPPEHVKFIFCTTDPEKIPITVLSRCQRFDFAPVELQQIVQRLRYIVDTEKAEAEDEALELIARRAAGSMRDSQSLLEQVLSFSAGKLTADQVHAMLGTANDERLHALADALANRDGASALQQVDAAIDAGVDAGRLAEQLLGYFRDLMAVAVGCDPSLLRHTSVAYFEPLRELADRWGLQTVLAVVGLVDQMLVRVRHSVYSRVLLEATLIQICNLPDLQQIADLAAAAQSSSGAASGRPAPRGSIGSAEKKKADVASRDVPTSLADRTDSSADSNGTTLASPSEDDRLSTITAVHRAESIRGPHLPPTSAAAATSGSRPPGLATEPNTEPSPPSPSLATPEAQAAPVAAAASSGEGFRWDTPTAQRVWREALGSLESMTETFAKVVESVRSEGVGTLRLTFPHDGGLAKRRCELPEHRSAIAEAVHRAAGKAIHLEFDLAPPPAPKVTEQPAANRPTRMQRMREIEGNPLVKSCVELFDAEILRIEKPR
jgi:DNA polymerase-3 subunit gamma/tau